MQNKFKLDTFEPRALKDANAKLDQKMLFLNLTKKMNDGYKQSIFKQSLWQTILRIFKWRN